MLESEVGTVIHRLKMLYRVSKDSELARALGISPQTLSSWRQRDTIPYALCTEVARKHSLSMDWLLYGKGTETLEPPQAVASQDAPSQYRAQQLRNALIEATDSLTMEDLEDILRQTRQMCRLRSLELTCERISRELEAIRSQQPERC